MSATPIISVRNLHREFDKVQAVRGVSFEVTRGQVVGFIGANGAGKTTTMRILATLDAPSQGEAEICGYDVMNYPHRVRAKVGWMPDAYGVYNHMTVVEYLDFYGRAYGLSRAVRHERLREVMAFADLTELADRPMNKLSKGMGQRLCLGRTLVHDPEVLILDEPAAGLDPKARIEFKNVVRLLAERGKTIFISSHILSELGEMCDSLLFIDAGRIVHHGSAESLREHEQTQAVIDVQLAGDPEALRRWASMNPGVALLALGKKGGRIGVNDDDPAAMAALLKRMIAEGLAVTDFHRESRKLEDAFIDMIKKVEPSRPPPPLPTAPSSAL